MMLIEGWHKKARAPEAVHNCLLQRRNGVKKQEQCEQHNSVLQYDAQCTNMMQVQYAQCAIVSGLKSKCNMCNCE